MIHCLRSNKQYKGETKRRLKDRFNEHRRPVDRPTPSSRPTAVSDHFLSDNHSPNDIELVPLESYSHLVTRYAKPGKCTLSKGIKLLNPKELTNVKKFNLMFNPLVPYVLYSILLFCHYKFISTVYFLFFIVFHFCYLVID